MLRPGRLECLVAARGSAVQVGSPNPELSSLKLQPSVWPSFCELLGLDQLLGFLLVSRVHLSRPVTRLGPEGQDGLLCASDSWCCCWLGTGSPAQELTSSSGLNRLPYTWGAPPRGLGGESRGPLKAFLGGCTVLRSSAQTKSQGQLTVKGWKIDSTS